ncbi:MAG: quinone oxidoreductase [Actinomycetota bacterium]|nr:quinone oxidoreductase [Actinomycetota bacterium]
MQAIRIHETGGPEVLVPDDVPVPEPGAGRVRVRVEAAGVNFIDIYQRSGAYKLELPLTLGLEGAGVVEALGPGVDGLAEGDRVAWAMQIGSYAEQVVVPTGSVVAVPGGIDLQVAAAVILQGATAHYLAHSTVPLEKGMTVLVTAAAGGAGRLLVQVAKRLGARVIGTVSNDEKEALARAAGADEIVRYRDVDLAAAVRDLTDGAGVDVVYDSVGRDTFAASLDSLRPRGHLVLYGQASGPVDPIDPQVLNAKGSLYLTRPTLGHYIAGPGELAWRAGDLFSWIAAGELDVRIDRTWPLAEAAEAHRYMAAGETKGKVLLLP